MGASLTLDGTTKTYQKGNQTHKIPIPRVTVYDLEQKIKDGFTLESFNKMMRRRGNLVQLNDAWQDDDGNPHNVREGKCVDDVITIVEGSKERTYKITNKEMLHHFYEVCAESIDADHKTFKVGPRLSIVSDSMGD